MMIASDSVVWGNVSDVSECSIMAKRLAVVQKVKWIMSAA